MMHDACREEYRQRFNDGKCTRCGTNDSAGDSTGLCGEAGCNAESPRGYPGQ